MFMQPRDVMKETFKTMLCAASILWIVSALLLASFAQKTAEITDKSQPSDVVCSSTEIRNNITDLLQLENCTVIEGHIAILLIDLDNDAAIQAISLPRLREITDYLLLYHVQYMKTLANIFPNLSVIRGRKLFYHYALVVFEMVSLEDLGLSSLMMIERGAVYAENNPQLCYVDTIDWSRITTMKEENRFTRNKKADECINLYPQKIESCPRTNVAIGDGQLVEVPLCWNFDTCQKICPAACSGGACYETEVEGVRCCHEECVGGCSGPTNADCFACKAIKYNGRCEKNCPPGLYEINGLRCVNEMGCKRFLARGDGRSWKIFQKDDRGFCLKECPLGYTAGTNATSHRCVRCSGLCPRICQGRIIDNIAAAETLEGCTVINGSLEILIAGGNLMDLEKFLGQIQEVTAFLRIINSNAITSLSFLRSLRMIRGEKLYHSDYAFFIHHNRNLENIWDVETHPNLTIDQGKVFFLDNPKLCLDKIYDFLAATVQRNKTDERDISTSTNGDLAACDTYDLDLHIEYIGPVSATVRWESFKMKDTRYQIGWVLNYRQVPDDAHITMHTGKEVCGDDVWKAMDVTPESMSASISDLLPFTKYAIYVKAYLMSGVRRGAMSRLVSFRTMMSAPSAVKKLSAKAGGTSELQLTWAEPEVPNGIITHYVVTWSIIEIDEAKFEKRDYCVDRPRPKDHGKDSKTSLDDSSSLRPASGSEDKCCQCPKSTQQLELEQKERQFAITFENHLHNFVYVKTNYGISSRVINKRDVEASEKRAGAAETGIESTSTLSPSADSMAAALGITSSPKSNPISKTVMEENRTLRRRQIWNSTTVVGNTSVILTDLTHFQEYWIEVIACHGDEMRGRVMEDSCSMPAMTAARTDPDNNADRIDTKSVTISRGQNETYLVQWSSPPNPNAVIIAFEVELSKVDIENYKPDVLCITHKAYQELNGTRYDRVMSWGNWSYRVRTLSLAGNGSWTSVQHFLVESPESSAQSNLQQHFLGTLAVIPLILILVAVTSYYVIRYKRQFVYPEVISYNPEYVNPEDLYEPDNWELMRDQVTLLDALGQGSFGMVYRGLFRHSDDDDKEPIEVAIKTVMESSTLRDRIAFLHEASVMKAFESYHVVKLLGIVSKGQPSLVVMELMSNGDLKTFLRKHRPDDLENEGMQPPPLQLILQMAGEIADGMAYLASKKFVHRDLAARNCMVSSDLTVKIGDFGLTRDIYATDYYRKSTKGLLPVRWMAPESLKDGVFTVHSDIWSYGIVLWEMATLATQPYQGLSNEEVLHYVIDGGKMTIPEKCPEKLVNLMSMCWNSTPKKRPTFEDVIDFLLPDLNSNFSVVSYYFTKGGEEGLDDIHDKEEEEEREEEEEEENSKTPLSISFAPVRSGPQPTGQREALSNGFSPRLGHGTNGEPCMTKPILEPFETDEDLSRSSSYPRLQPSHEGLSNGKHGPIRSSMKSAVNLLASLATSSRPSMVHIADVKRSAPDQMQHQLVSL